MSTRLEGTPEGGFSDAYIDQDKMNSLVKQMEGMLDKKGHFGAGMDLLFAMNILLPGCMNFQEGSMNREVEAQNALNQILNDFRDMQAQFDACEGEKSPDSVRSDQILSDWKDALGLANSTLFGPRDDQNKTKLFHQLYDQSGSYMQTYDQYKAWSNGTIHLQKDVSSLSTGIYNAWHLAQKKPQKGSDEDYDGDNGLGVKNFQDYFNSIDAVASGQSGTVNSVMKYEEQVYSSIESVTKNLGQQINSNQKNAVDGTKAS